MNQKLKQRTITAIFFGATVLALLLSSVYTALLFLLLVGILAGAELLLITNTTYTKQKAYITSTLFNILIFFIIYNINEVNYIQLIHISAIFMLFYIFLIYFKGEQNIMKRSILFMCTYIILPMGLMARHFYDIEFQAFAINIILLTLFLIWANDSFAYLIGSKIGKNKLFESVSPNKTWEGYFGGGIMAIVTGVILSFALDYDLTIMIIIAWIAWVIGTYGDLFESKIKRTFGVKDSGDILPGHGGFLDRFDSFIFVAPFVLLVIYYFS
jgi:phosphatidate cytidylyltransferase